MVSKWGCLFYCFICDNKYKLFIMKYVKVIFKECLYKNYVK